MLLLQDSLPCTRDLAAVPWGVCRESKDGKQEWKHAKRWNGDVSREGRKNKNYKQGQGARALGKEGNKVRQQG